MNTELSKAFPPAALLVALGCATTAPPPPSPPLDEPEELSVQGPYKHPSGLEFPEGVAGIERAEVTRYDRVGQDVGASYVGHGTAELVASIYVYPGPTLEQVGSPKEAVAASLAHFDEVKRHVVAQHQGVKLINEEQFPMMVKGTEYPALRATMDFEGQWFGAVRPLRSHVYLVTFFGGRWIIKYRFTHPRDQKDEVVNTFVKEWPGPH